MRIFLFLFFTVLLFLLTERAQAFNLGINASAEYTPSLEYQLTEGNTKQKFIYKGLSQSVQLYGTGSIAGVPTDFGIYAMHAAFQNAYTEPHFEVDENSVETEKEPGKETMTKNSLGVSLTTHFVKGSWIVSRISLGLNQMKIQQTGLTPVDQYYHIGAELRGSIGFAPPPGRAGPTFEIGYQSLNHLLGKQDGETNKKLQPIKGTGFFISLGMALLIF